MPYMTVNIGALGDQSALMSKNSFADVANGFFVPISGVLPRTVLQLRLIVR